MENGLLHTGCDNGQVSYVYFEVGIEFYVLIVVASAYVAP